MFRIPLCLAAVAVANAASATLFLVNSPAPYLRTNGETTYTPGAIDLAANGFLPGQTVLLMRLGQYNFDASPAVAFGMSAVFSSSSAILPETAPNRIPGAIAAGPGWVSPNTAVGNLSTDIPEDFQVCNFSGASNGITLTIPAGAQYIFAAAQDDFFSDDNNYPEFYLSIAPVPEPSSPAGLAVGAIVFLRRRRRRGLTNHVLAAG